MPIVIDYGNIGPALEAARKSGFAQQQNDNAKLALQALNIQNDYAAAMAAAASRVVAQEQESRDQANALTARSFMNAQDIQGRYDLAEYDHYNQMNRDAYLANMQNARDERMFQQKLAYDRENDARTFQQQREQMRISRGIPLTPNEAMELSQLQRGMASLDAQLADGTLHPTEHQQMVQSIAPRLNYLDMSRMSAEERQRTEAERNANRMRNFTLGHFPDPNSPPVLDENGRPQIIPPGELFGGMVRRQNTILVQTDDSGQIRVLDRSMQQQQPRPITPLQFNDRVMQQMATLRREIVDAQKAWEIAPEQERRAMSQHPEWWDLPRGPGSVGPPVQETTYQRMLREATRRVRTQMEAANEYIPGNRGGQGGGLGGQPTSSSGPARSEIDAILAEAARSPRRPAAGGAAGAVEGAMGSAAVGNSTPIPPPPRVEPAAPQQSRTLPTPMTDPGLFWEWIQRRARDSMREAPRAPR